MTGIETRSAPQPAEANSGLQKPRRMIAIASVLSAMALVVLDAAIANVALPAIAGALHVTPAMSVLVITAYQTALVIGLLPCAALGESLGYRRVFTAGVALFTGASVACAMAPSLPLQSWRSASR
jgi:MFS transporter, DHA2 family, multidrug resistance protein